MNKYTINYSDKIVYHETLSNGLNIYLLPSKEESTYYIDLSVRYGAKDLNYYLDGKEINDQEGMAHYIEHQLFNMEDSDAFNYFSSSGTNANAWTSREMTKYYIYGERKIMSNLKYFLKMLFTPFFTDESVNKERGIIGEEIKMYEDEDSEKLERQVRKNLFQYPKNRLAIAGSVDSISKIKKEDLYRAYHYFYIPSNMTLTIFGKFNLDKVLSILREDKLLNNLTNHEINLKEEIEKPYVNKEYSLIVGKSEIPKLDYMFKIDTSNLGIKDKFLLHSYLSLIFSKAFNTYSLFNEEVTNNKESFYYSYDINYVDHYCILDIYAESDKGDLFKERVDEYLSKLSIEELDIERFIKEIQVYEINISDRITNIASSIHRDIKLYGRPYFNISNILKDINKETCNAIIKKLDFSNQTFVLMYNERVN